MIRLIRELVARSRIWLARYLSGTCAVSPGHHKEEPAATRSLSGLCNPVLALPRRKSQGGVARVHDSSASARSERCRPLSPGGDSMVAVSTYRGGTRLGGKSCDGGVMPGPTVQFFGS